MEKGIEAKEIKNESSKEGETKRYDLPPEEYLNPQKIEALSGEIHGNGERVRANIAYQNMMGNVFEQKALSQKMSDRDIEALATVMVEKYDTSMNESQGAEKAEAMEKEEIENKRELQKETNESPVFLRAVEALKEYLAKYPKVAHLALVGVLASELNGCASTGNMTGGMIYTGISGMQQTAYTQMQGMQQSQYADMQGRQQSAYAEMQGQQQAEYSYGRETQDAENERQRAYQQLDNYIEQLRSSGQENQASRDISMKRGQIEDRYNQRIYNAQINYQRAQDQILMRQQQIQEQSQMRAQQIQIQTQMRQQQIQMDTGARLMNQALYGILQGMRR